MAAPMGQTARMDRVGNRADLARIERFVLRARRVQAHSLCQDPDRLDQFAENFHEVERTSDEVFTTTAVLPDEELLESLAARVRPVLLEADGVHYSTALKAIQAELHRGGHREHIGFFKTRRQQFEAVDPKRASGAGVTMLIAQMHETQVAAPRTVISEGKLADTWFYADLVHADAARADAVSGTDLDERFAAASARVCQIAILVIEVLGYVQWLATQGLLDLDWDALTVPSVKVKVAQPVDTVLGVALPQDIAEGRFDPVPWFQGSESVPHRERVVAMLESGMRVKWRADD